MIAYRCARDVAISGERCRSSDSRMAWPMQRACQSRNDRPRCLACICKHRAQNHVRRNATSKFIGRNPLVELASDADNLLHLIVARMARNVAQLDDTFEDGAVHVAQDADPTG